MALGALAGFADVGAINSFSKVTADLFLRLLKLISLPIIFLSIASTITGMKDFAEMRQMGRRVVLYTIGTTVVAASLALGLFLSIDPASSSAPLPIEAVASEATAKPASYLSFLQEAIPSNLLQPFLESNVIAIAFIAFGLSIASLFLPTHQKEHLHALFSSLFAILLKLTGALLRLMPLAVFAFITLLIKDLRQNSHPALGSYLLCVVLANLIQGLIILPIFLKAKGVSPWKACRAMMPALTLAFLSKSSNATLPVTMQSVEKMGISKKISSFTLPLCSVINMNGCAAFILITVLFVGKLYGMAFSPFELVGWIFLATLAAIGNAGVPMGCFFLASAFLVGMDLPLYMMGLILPFYTFLDMIETTLNVWSDGCIAIAVDRDLVSLQQTSPVTEGTSGGSSDQ